MTLVWRAQMSIDGGLIDEDHKCLIALVNAVHSVQPGAAMQGELVAILDRLNTYARVHFQREERLMAAAHFVNASAHGKYHTNVIRDLDTLRSECAARLDSKQSATIRQRAGLFLDDWLIDHITRSDRLMKPFVDQMRALADGMVSLDEADISSQIEVREYHDALDVLGYDTWQPEALERE